jgi:hypothetical protein
MIHLLLNNLARTASALGAGMNFFLVGVIARLDRAIQEMDWILRSSRRMTVLSLTFTHCALGAGFLTYGDKGENNR